MSLLEVQRNQLMVTISGGWDTGDGVFWRVNLSGPLITATWDTYM